MSTNNYKVRDQQPTVLRLNPELRARLMRDAKAHGRSLTKEIELLLQASIDTQDLPIYARPATRALTTGEPGAQGFTEMEQAVLDVFRRLPPEKQLALLSLFK